MEVRVAAVRLVLLCFLVFRAVNSVRADRTGFIVTFPKSASLHGSPVRVCYTGVGVERIVRTLIRVTIDDRVCETASDGGTERDTCLDAIVNCSQLVERGPLSRSSNLLLRLTLTGMTTSGETFSKSYSKNIPVKESSKKTFIQTDKPTYQPGQKVLFRILTINYPDMMPETRNVSMVWISSPGGTRMRQWYNLSRNKGLLDLDFTLSSEALLGIWLIHIRDGRNVIQSFSVEEYVLPKFEVLIMPPSYLYKQHEGNFNIKVCARYTYGQPVRGRVSANVSIDGRQGFRAGLPTPPLPFEVAANESSGCADIVVQASLLLVNYHTFRHARDLKLLVNARFAERGTGVMIQASSSSCNITDTKYKLELTSPDTFKPGLPYRGKVAVTMLNGVPVENQRVEVYLLRGRRHVFRTEADGTVAFQLQMPFDPYTVSESLTVLVSFRDLGTHIRESKKLRAWYSPSTSFLDVRATPLKVNTHQLVPVELQFTLPSNESITEIQFFYRVISRGRIVARGQDTWYRSSSGDEAGVGVGVEMEVRSGASHYREARAAYHMSASSRTYHRMRHTVGVPHIRRHLQRISNTVATGISPYKNVILGQMQINIEANAVMSPMSRVLVYYIRADGEVVSDSTTFKMAPAFRNQVSLEFLEGQEVRPGHPVSLEVTADPQSLCAIGVVDKSVHIMGGNNQLTKSKVFSPVSALNELTGDANTSCPSTLPTRDSSPTAKHLDAAEAFRKSGLDFATDLDIETRPCYVTTYQLVSVPSFVRPSCFFCNQRLDMPLGVQGQTRMRPITGLEALPMRMFSMVVEQGQEPQQEPGQEPKPLVELRNFFPETWLWKIAPVGDDGRLVTREEIPHTITDWVASAFCLSADRGIGVADSRSVKAFQPFFLSYTLPYSVIRGEKVPVKVTVFNYLTTCLNIEISLSENSIFSIEARPNSEIVEVCGNSAETLEYEIVPFELGDLPIRVDAVAQPPTGGGEAPNNLFTSPITDAIEDTILVEPEGAEREETFSDLICPSSNFDNFYMRTVPLRLPSLAVPGSARGRIQIIGDMMGPVMSNLDGLLRMPFGCGEQNMIFMAPNIYVLRYLSQTDQLTSEINEKALTFMRSGYQRELGYQLHDGSYSAFGESDGVGSTWLTAFVLKSFSEARPFMKVDKANLARTKQWLLRHRRDENGCIMKQGRVIHKEMQGSVSSPVTLTAFVAIALLENGVSPHTRERDSVSMGMGCIRNWLETTEEDDMDTYSLAIISYVLGLYGDYSNQITAIYLLEDRIQGDDELRYWSNNDVSETEDTMCIDHCHAPSSDIEVTSYALLAYLHQQDPEFNYLYQEVMPIVKWLNTQRNGLGGFSSTQDTVLGLQALSAFSERFYNPNSPLALDISVNATRPSSPEVFQERSFVVTGDNRLVLQREQLAEVPTEITVIGMGAGCALFQAELRYNMPVLSPNRLLFHIAVSVRDLEGNNVHDSAACGDKTVEICVRYTGSGEETNMAVMEVKMVSGYIPYENSLERFHSSQGNAIGLKRIDKYEKGKPLALYFDQFDATARCVPIDMKQEFIVKDAKDAVIKVYDYYKPGVVGFKSYNTCEN